MRIREKAGNILWIFFMSASIFFITAAVWIRKTYGTLNCAMANESFRNWLENKRSLFAKYVVLPTLIVWILLLIVHIVWKKRSRRVITYASIALMILFLIGGGVILKTGSYLARVYRLSQEQWYDKDDRIMHALGRIDGKAYTNSREALENSYRNGRRLMECDIILTADGEIAACHDWEYWNRKTGDETAENEDYVPTLEAFMERRWYGEYTPLSGDDIVLFMKEHEDLYLITDTKYVEPEEVREEFEALVNTAVRNGCEEVLDRFVVQIYHAYMKGIVDEIYPFPNYIFTLYQEGFHGEPDRLEEYAQFCMEYNVDVITMWEDRYRREFADVAKRHGLRIFVHTVNDEDKIASFIEQGVGVYTDNP